MLVTYGSWSNLSLLLFYFNVALCYTAELCGHQFKGIMPMLSPNVNEKDTDLFSEQKEKEKMKFDAKSKQLPELFQAVMGLI